MDYPAAQGNRVVAPADQVEDIIFTRRHLLLETFLKPPGRAVRGHCATSTKPAARFIQPEAKMA